MGQTTNFKLPYPELSDPPNVPADMKRLADVVDAALVDSRPRTVWRSTNATPTTITNGLTFSLTAGGTTDIDESAGYVTTVFGGFTVVKAGVYRLNVYLQIANNPSVQNIALTVGSGNVQHSCHVSASTNLRFNCSYTAEAAVGQSISRAFAFADGKGQLTRCQTDLVYLGSVA